MGATVTSPAATDRISNLDVLRAIAALAVCFYHFRRGAMFEGSVYQSVASYGVYGVDVFFVISGYVIPLALWKRGFGYSQTGSFWLARFIRLYPAYLLASVIGFGLWYLSTVMPGFRGAPPPPVTTTQVWANLALAADLARQDWFLGVAWTLAIEAQYYVLVVLSFPLLVSKRPAWRVGALACWVLCPLALSNPLWVFHWTALFGMGVAVMLRQQGLLERRWLMAFLAASFLVQCWARGGVSAGVGVATALFILLAPPVRASWLVWVGGISYSLYLLHVPIGGRVMNFFERYPDSVWALLISVPLAVAASIVAAWVFFKVVEWPSHQLARGVRWSKVAKR